MLMRLTPSARSRDAFAGETVAGLTSKVHSRTAVERQESRSPTEQIFQFGNARACSACRRQSRSSPARWREPPRACAPQPAGRRGKRGSSSACSSRRKRSNTGRAAGKTGCGNRDGGSLPQLRACPRQLQCKASTKRSDSSMTRTATPSPVRPDASFTATTSITSADIMSIARSPERADGAGWRIFERGPRRAEPSIVIRSRSYWLHRVQTTLIASELSGSQRIKQAYNQPKRGGTPNAEYPSLWIADFIFHYTNAT